MRDLLVGGWGQNLLSTYIDTQNLEHTSKKKISLQNFSKINKRSPMFILESRVSRTQHCRGQHSELPSCRTGFKSFHLHFIFPLSLLISLTNHSVPCPNVSTTPLRQWGFRQCLPFIRIFLIFFANIKPLLTHVQETPPVTLKDKVHYD